MKKTELDKFMDNKNNFLVGAVKDENGRFVICFGKRYKYEKIVAVRLVYNTGEAACSKAFAGDVKDEEKFMIAFDDRGRTVICDNDTLVTGGFEGSQAKFQVLILLKNYAVSLVYDSQLMRYPCILYSEGEAQVEPFVSFCMKLGKMKFCAGEVLPYIQEDKSQRKDSEAGEGEGNDDGKK